jgi:uncharacterized protein
MIETDFIAPWAIASPHVQSLLASGSTRIWSRRREIAMLRTVTRNDVLELPGGVRLQVWVSLPTPPAKAVVVLLHGWEGSAQSTYQVATAASLLAEGYAVYRLDFRDHGETYHLNPDVFHSCRLAEVVDAVHAIGARHAHLPLLLAGYSLGGNFALRVGLVESHAAATQVKAIVAICPPVRPLNTITAIERAPFFYQQYFLKKWRHSLQRKAECFPDRYPFHSPRERSRLRRLDLLKLTVYLIEQYTEFASARDYLEAYGVHEQRLSALKIPTTILAAADDPVCPADDLALVGKSTYLQTLVTRHGGHCGFVQQLTQPSYAETLISRRFAEALASADVGPFRAPAAHPEPQAALALLP